MKSSLRLGLTTSASFTEFESSLSSAVKSHASKGRVLILTDMFGGTPSRIGMTLHETGKVEVVTGVSLPMLLKALQLSESDEDLIEIAQKVRKTGERGISVASEILGESNGRNRHLRQQEDKRMSKSETTVTITHSYGLHLRAAGTLAQKPAPSRQKSRSQ